MSTTKITGRNPSSGRSMSVKMEDGVITLIEETDSDTDLHLSAGFVDLQVNGCSGFDVNAPQLTPDTITDLVDVMLSRGVACFAPTVITAPEDRICHVISVICRGSPESTTGCRVHSVCPFGRTADLTAGWISGCPSCGRAIRVPLHTQRSDQELRGGFIVIQPASSKRVHDRRDAGILRRCVSDAANAAPGDRSMCPHRRHRRRIPRSARSVYRSDRKRRHIARLRGRPFRGRDRCAPGHHGGC
jgi:hypothetical protein